MTVGGARMDEEPNDDESHTVVVGFGHSRGLRAERLATLALVLIIVAIIKPWGPGSPPAAVIRPSETALATAVPTVGPLLADLPCVGGRWSVEADERWVETVLRTWVLTDAVEATGPTDPAIRFVTVAAQQVISLGYCAAFGDDAGLKPTVTFFRLTPYPMIVPTTTFRMAPEAEAAANVLFRPAAIPKPSALVVEPMTWPAGRYVMRIDGPAGYRRYLGVDVRLVLTSLAAP